MKLLLVTIMTIFVASECIALEGTAENSSDPYFKMQNVTKEERGGVLVQVPSLNIDEMESLVSRLRSNLSDDINIYDLILLDTKTLRLLRNEIFARKRYKFKSRDLQEYFKQFVWYKPEDRPIELEAKEKINVEKMLKIEEVKGIKIEGEQSTYNYSGFEKEINGEHYKFKKVSHCNFEQNKYTSHYVLEFFSSKNKYEFYGRCVSSDDIYHGYEHKIYMAKHNIKNNRVYVREYDQFPLGDLGFGQLNIFDLKGNNLLNISGIRGTLLYDSNKHYVAVDYSGCCGATNDTLNIFDENGEMVLKEGGDGYSVSDISPINDKNIVIVMQPAGGERGWGEYSKAFVIAEDGSINFDSKIENYVNGWLNTNTTVRLDPSTIYIKYYEDYEIKQALLKYWSGSYGSGLQISMTKI